MISATHSIADNLNGIFVCNITSNNGLGVDFVVKLDTNSAKVKYLETEQ